MATTIPCTVDTTPMAVGINSVSNHVKGTTAAVVTMQSAVIAAENNSANKVCSNVNRGFFTMIRSQISQKIANKHSRVEALIMHLAQQKRQLVSIKTNMEREYGRISERYFKIFTGINKELETRIKQLDQPVFELVSKHMLTSSNRMNALTSWASTSQAESLTQAQRMLLSKMKYNTQVAIEQSAEFLAQINKQRVITDSILISSSKGNNDTSIQVPVVIYETINNPSNIPTIDVRTNETMSGQHPAIQTAILTQTHLPWVQQELPSLVTEEFMHLVESSSMESRVKGLIQKMYTSTPIETI